MTHLDRLITQHRSITNHSTHITQWWIQDFPLGGVPTHWGGANLRHVHFSVKTYAKMKEFDPVGGARAGGAPPPDLPMSHNVSVNLH